ncbi:unnamed protein product [Orchesella dallaii]|uniref:Uncharacterized protein n=1 Tax=Orchesella dallaii TaxID=48710 RepID=A0ABP1QD91_9HEXA
MQSVEYFYLNFEVCDRVFNLLMGYTKFPNVVQFGFVFDSERFSPQSFSLQLIKRVFTTSIESIKSVAIHKIGSAGPFNQHTHTLERMPNVSDLSLRATSHCNSTCSYHFDYPYLFDVFPNLKKIRN